MPLISPRLPIKKKKPEENALAARRPLHEAFTPIGSRAKIKEEKARTIKTEVQITGLGAGRTIGAPLSHASLTCSHTSHTVPAPPRHCSPRTGASTLSAATPKATGAYAAGRRCGALEARRTGAASL